MAKNKLSSTATRRKFLGGAAVAGVATIAMPQVSRAQTVTWKIPVDLADQGHLPRLRRSTTPRRSTTCRAAVSSSTCSPPAPWCRPFSDGRRGASRRSRCRSRRVAPTGTASTRPIRCSAPPPSLRLGRPRHSGLVLLRRRRGAVQGTGQRHPQAQPHRLPRTSRCRPSRSAGSRRRSRAGDDFKGMKYRTVGLSADLFKEMGAAVTILPGGEIVPAMDRGLLDCGRVQQSVVRHPARLPGRVEVLHDGQPPSADGSVRDHLQQGQVRRAAGRAEGDPAQCRVRRVERPALACRTTATRRTLEEIRKRGVNVIKTGRKVLNDQLAAWDKVIAAQSQGTVLHQGDRRRRRRG